MFYICCKDQNKIQRHNNKDQNKNHKGHTAGIKSIIANDKIINEPSAMANEFNGCFSKIGRSISDSVKQIDKKPEDFLPEYDENKPKFSLDNTWDLFIFVIL